jgi:hypothetical protein
MTWRPAPQGPCPCCGPELANTRPIDSDRMTRNERAMNWPDVPAEPAGGGDRLGHWIENTDPAPVEPPPEPKPLPPVPESSYPPDAVDLPAQLATPRWRRFIDSIRTTTRKA